jgi:hypothetical protein
MQSDNFAVTARACQTLDVAACKFPVALVAAIRNNIYGVEDGTPESSNHVMRWGEDVAAEVVAAVRSK